MTITFDQVWNTLQSHLRPGMVIKNWTAFSGYIGEDSTIVHLSQSDISVDAPGAKTIQHVPRNDFKAVWEVWEGYKKGKVPREELRDITRFSKYIISILHWYEIDIANF